MFNKKCSTQLKNQKGFTAIELTVVIGVIAVLASQMAPAVMDLMIDSKVTTAKTEINQIANAVSKVYTNDEEYPSVIAFADIEHQLPSNVDKVNPWGIDYVITNGGITYGSGCSKTSRTSDPSLFNIELELPTSSDATVQRVADDYDDCTASTSGMKIQFEFE